MAIYSDPKCHQCPYCNRGHLQTTGFYIQQSVPLSAERGNSSGTLLVFQAPGVAEWITGRPLQAIGNKNTSAGVRIHNSWGRKGKVRSDFDITNSVQCFPGKYKNNRDKRPRKPAIIKCLEWLKSDILKGKYTKIIAFGKLAQNQVDEALLQLGLTKKIVVIKSVHPTGAVSSQSLDNLW